MGYKVRMAEQSNLPEVLMISKPIAPPWNDAAKNIVRSQVIRGKRYRYRVLTPKPVRSEQGGPSPLPDSVATAPIYSDPGKHSPSLLQNARVFSYGLLPRGAAIYHYFFAPNRMSSSAGRLIQGMNRVRTVQTICSRPASFEQVSGLLFTDLVIVLSEETRGQMIAAGVPASKLRLVRPCIEPIDKPDPARRREIRRANGLPEKGPLVIFPGDYRFSSAADTVARAVPLLRREMPDITVVFACRIKGPGCAEQRERIREQMAQAGCLPSIRFLETPTSMPEVIGTADAALMPAESLYAKMDFPLVLLEAMAQEVPLVLADVAPLTELVALGAGVRVPHGDPAALSRTTLALLRDEALGRSLGQGGRRAVEELFSADAMTSAVEAVYDEVLGQ